MMDPLLSSVFLRPRAALAMVLGTNEIASAVAVHLHRAGYGVVLSQDDTSSPVIRRGMSFHDALFGDPVVVDGLAAEAVERVTQVLTVTALHERVAITRLGLVDLMAIGPFGVIVDARMQKYAQKPDLRHLADATIGLGPGFTVGVNCDVAVETRPARNGALLTRGTTDAPDGVANPLGGAGRERFVRTATSGRWRTAHHIGARVFKGMVLGHLDRVPVVAPLDGQLRGLVRDGTEVPEGVKLIEIDPRSRWQARWTGIDDRGRAIAETTALAAHAFVTKTPAEVSAT